MDWLIGFAMFFFILALVLLMVGYYAKSPIAKTRSSALGIAAFELFGFCFAAICLIYRASPSWWYEAFIISVAICGFAFFVLAIYVAWNAGKPCLACCQAST